MRISNFNLDFKHKILVISVDLLLCILFLFRTSIITFMLNTIPKCPFGLAGYPCPSCGGTRFAKHFANFDFSRAIAYNAYFFILSIYFFVLLVFANLGFVFNLCFFKKLFILLTNKNVIISLAVGWLVFGIIRLIFLN